MRTEEAGRPRADHDHPLFLARSELLRCQTPGRRRLFDALGKSPQSLRLAERNLHIVDVAGTPARIEAALEDLNVLDITGVDAEFLRSLRAQFTRVGLKVHAQIPHAQTFDLRLIHRHHLDVGWVSGGSACPAQSLGKSPCAPMRKAWSRPRCKSRAPTSEHCSSIIRSPVAISSSARSTL